MMLQSENMVSAKELISVIIPCRNEERWISACLDSVLRFIIPEGAAVEILVIDGISEDKTAEIVRGFTQKYPQIWLLTNPGRIQSCGLNIGIKSAKGEYILRLDAHSTYPMDYLSLCYETMKKTDAENVGGILITSVDSDAYEASIVQTITTCPFGIGNSGFRVGKQSGFTDTVPFGFFKRELFDKIGYFDERLVRNQDYEFNRRILKSGGKIWINPKIRISYYNQAKFLTFLKKQYQYEAPYNVYMWFLAPYTFHLRHIVTGLFAAGFIVGSLFSIWLPIIRTIFMGVMSLYIIFALLASVQSALKNKRCLDIFVLPWAFFLFHFIHGLGILKGIGLLLLGKSPVQNIKEPWPGYGKYRINPIKNLLDGQSN